MRDVIKPGLTLFVLTAVVALLLAVAQNGAAGATLRNEREAKQAALFKALPGLARLDAAVFFGDDVPVGDGSGVVSYNEAATGSAYGYAITVETKGYSGTIRLLVGINKNGVVEGVTILKHSETPGLGANAPKAAFVGQYADKTGPFHVVKTVADEPDEIHAITAATITSRAVTDGVNAAIQYYSEHLAEGGGGR